MPNVNRFGKNVEEGETTLMVYLAFRRNSSRTYCLIEIFRIEGGNELIVTKNVRRYQV